MNSYQTILPINFEERTSEIEPKPGALNREFYRRDPETVAKELLGKFLIHETEGGTIITRIVETEAYLGQSDPACHASVGLTKRTKLFFGLPGIAYIFINYGINNCLNAITSPIGKAGCVLIRAVEPIKGIDLMKINRGNNISNKNLTNGPGKLTKAMGINMSLNGADLISGNLYIKNSKDKFKIQKTTRIGISKAIDKQLRFYIKNNNFVSGSVKFNSKGIDV